MRVCVGLWLVDFLFVSRIASFHRVCARSALVSFSEFSRISRCVSSGASLAYTYIHTSIWIARDRNGVLGARAASV